MVLYNLNGSGERLGQEEWAISGDDGKENVPEEPRLFRESGLVLSYVVEWQAI